MHNASVQKISQFITTEKLRRYALISVIACIAFAVLLKGGKALESTWILVGVAWFCSMQYWSNHPERKMHLHLGLWCMVLLFVLWTVLSYLSSSTQNYGLDEVFRTTSLVFLFLWMGRTLIEEGIAAPKTDGRTTVEILFLSIAWLTVVACIVGCFVYLLQPVERFVGTFFDHRFHTDYWPNAWAQYVLLTWPIVFWWTSDITSRLDENRKSLQHIVSVVILGFVLGCFLLSYSRGALVALLGQVVLWITLQWFITQKILWKQIVLRACGICIVSLIIFMGLNVVRSATFDVTSVQEKATFQADEGTSSISERRQFWKQATILTMSRPVLGWGPYSFRFVQPRLQQGIRATSDHPHNIFLKFSSERGVLVVVLFAALVAAVLLISLRAKKRNTHEVLQHQDVILLLIVAVCGVLAHSLIDYNLQFVAIALPFWLFLGMLSVFLYQVAGSHFSRRVILALELLIMTAILIVAISEGKHLLTSSFGRHAQARGEHEHALFWYAQSSDQLYSRDLHLSRAQLFLKDGQHTQARYVLDAYFDQNMEDARAWKLKGDACLQGKNYVCALTSYELAYDYNRSNDLAGVRAYIEMLNSVGRRPEIDQRRREFELLMNEYALAIEQNTHFITLSSSVEDLIAMAELFAELYPDDEPQYAVLAARIRHKADIEREKWKGRPLGRLW